MQNTEQVFLNKNSAAGLGNFLLAFLYHLLHDENVLWRDINLIQIKQCGSDNIIKSHS